MDSVQYLRQVLLVLASFEFEFDALVAHGYPLVPDVQRNKMVIAPDLLAGRHPPPFMEVPAMSLSTHKMLQHKHADHIYMLQHAETNQVVSDYCFKLKYFDDDDDQVTELVSRDLEKKQFRVHPFVMDSLVMFGLQEQYSSKHIHVYGTFLIKWHVGAGRQKHVRMAGLTIMSSLQKYVSLHEYLTETLGRRNFDDLSLELSPLPLQPFLEALLKPIFKDFDKIEKGFLELHHYSPTVHNILIYPESGDWVFKEAYDCGLVIPAALVCMWKQMDGKLEDYRLVFVSATAAAAAAAAAVVAVAQFNSCALVQSLKTEWFDKRAYPLLPDDDVVDLDILAFNNTTEAEYRPRIHSKDSLAYAIPNICNQMDVFNVARLLYGQENDSYMDRLETIDELDRFCAALKLTVWARHDNFYSSFVYGNPIERYQSASNILKLAPTSSLAKFREALGCYMLGRFVLFNYDVVDVSAASTDINEYLEELQRFTEHDNNRARLFLMLLLSTLRSRVANNTYCMACVILWYSYMEPNAILNYDYMGNKDLPGPYTPTVNSKALFDEMVEEVGMLYFHSPFSIIDESFLLEIIKVYDQAVADCAIEFDRQRGSPGRIVTTFRSNSDDTVADIVPRRWLPSAAALAVLPMSSRMPLPFSVRRRPGSFDGKTLDDLTLDHLIEVFKYLTATEVWALQTVSVFIADVINNRTCLQRLGASFWTTRVLAKTLLDDGVRPAHLQVVTWFDKMNEFEKEIRNGDLYEATLFDAHATFSPYWFDQRWTCLCSWSLVNCRLIQNIPDYVLDACPNLKEICIKNCGRFRDCSELGRIQKVVLIKLDQLEDIDGLAACESVSIDSCEKIRSYNPLKNCRSVSLNDLPDFSGPFDELEHVENLQLTARVYRDSWQRQLRAFLTKPNHRHKTLTLKNLRDDQADDYNLSTVANFTQVETLIIEECMLADPQHVQFWKGTKHITLKLMTMLRRVEKEKFAEMCLILKSMAHLESVTIFGYGFCADLFVNVDPFDAMCIALGSTTHFQFAVQQKMFDAITPGLSYIKRLSLMIENTDRPISLEAWLPKLENVETLWLDNFQPSAENWKAVYTCVKTRQKACPTFCLYWNKILMTRDDVRRAGEIYEWLANYRDVSQGWRNPKLGFAVDGTAWLTFDNFIFESSVQRQPLLMRQLGIHCRREPPSSCVVDDHLFAAARRSDADDDVVLRMNDEVSPHEQQVAQTVRIQVGNGQWQTLTRKEAFGSQLIQGMIGEQSVRKVDVFLPNIPNAEMFKYCAEFLKAMLVPGKIVNVEEKLTPPLDVASAQSRLTEFERDWLRRVWTSGRIVDIFLMADYLHIQPMTRLLLVLLATILCTESVEEIQRLFKMPSTDRAFAEYPEFLREIEASLEFLEKNK